MVYSARWVALFTVFPFLSPCALLAQAAPPECSTSQELHYLEAYNRVHDPIQLRSTLEALYTNADEIFETYPHLTYSELLQNARQDYFEFNHQEQRTLSDFEHLAIWSYTSLDSGILNTALRTQKSTPLSPDLETLKQGLQCGLSHLPNFEGVVIRGLQENALPAGFFRSHFKGSIVKYSAFTSASACTENQTGKQILIHSKHGKKIGAYSGAGDLECEVLFPPDTCFEVVKSYGEYGHRKGIRAELKEIECPSPLSSEGKSIKTF